MENQAETRWVVLCSDGRHSTLGRDRDPDQDDIMQAESALEAQALGGWLALLKGRYYDGRRRPALMMIRPLGRPAGSWEEAAAAFEAIRQNTVGPF